MMAASPRELVGLVPAAGRAQRIAPLPCSKEIYPIGFRRSEQSGHFHTEVVSHQLFDKFRRARATRAVVILREGKWDIPSYFGEGDLVGVSLAYVVAADSIGPADTLDRAYSFVKNDTVLFGFPDILFGPDDAFERLVNRLDESRADVVLGLFPELESQPTDMVDVDDTGRIRSIVLGPQGTPLRYTWGCAVWRPAFTEFMRGFLRTERAKAVSNGPSQSSDRQPDLTVGVVLKRAVEKGIEAHGVILAEEGYLDIGTPANLIEAMRRSLSR
jgi:glucose-1-phosphate thymidylyltransferase